MNNDISHTMTCIPFRWIFQPSKCTIYVLQPPKFLKWGTLKSYLEAVKNVQIH